MNERLGELGGRMTFINFSDLHVFEALLAKGLNGFDDLHQVFLGWVRHVEAGFFLLTEGEGKATFRYTWVQRN